MLRARRSAALKVCFALGVSAACVVPATGFHGALAQTAPGPSLPGKSSPGHSTASPGKAELDSKVAALTQALNDKRYGALVTDIPPKLLAVIAAKVNMTRDKLISLLEEQVTKTMSSASIDSFEITPGEIKALPNGAPYALLPSITRIAVDNRKAVSHGHVVAIVDDGKWYLARISEQQWPIFVEAYPNYASLDIPKEKLEFTK